MIFEKSINAVPLEDLLVFKPPILDIKEKNLPQILGQTLFVQGTGKFEFRKIDKYYFCKIFGANSKTRPPTYGLEKP